MSALTTEANQKEMQRQLRQLAVQNKKAKLQELFERQDELRPFGKKSRTRTRTRTRTQSSAEAAEEAEEEAKEMEAMKDKFQDMQKQVLMKQSSQQYLLRLQSAEEADADGDADADADADDGGAWDADCECDTPLPARVTSSVGYGSDEKHERSEASQMAEMAEMEAEFGKQSKAALTTQIEKNFELRVGVGAAVAEDPLETRAEPQIRRGHRRAFKLLLADIGVVNESIVDALWRNIAHTVHENKVCDDADTLQRLKAENRSLRRKLEQLSKQVQHDDVDEDEDD